MIAAGWAALADALAVGPGMRILEVGCGEGGFLKRLRDAGHTVSGCDVDSQSIRVAREIFGLAETHVAGHARTGSWDAVSMIGLGCTLITGIVLAHSLYESRRGDAAEQLSSE